MQLCICLKITHLKDSSQRCYFYKNLYSTCFKSRLRVRETQLLRVLLLEKTQVLLLAPTYMAAYNHQSLQFQEADLIFWPPWAPGMHVVCRHNVQAEYTHI